MRGGKGKGVQAGAAQSHSTLEPDFERSPFKPPERILSGMPGARSESSTKSLKGRGPTGEPSVWPGKQVPWAPSGPGRQAYGEMENWKAQGIGQEEERGEKERAGEKPKCGKSERENLKREWVGEHHRKQHRGDRQTKRGSCLRGPSEEPPLPPAAPRSPSDACRVLRTPTALARRGQHVPKYVVCLPRQLTPAWVGLAESLAPVPWVCLRLNLGPGMALRACVTECL